MTRGFLVTADGAAFAGTSIAAPGIASGEAVFNTAMTGYQEVLTDPSYSGQLVVMTSPHIGNCGVTELDLQSDRLRCSGTAAAMSLERGTDRVARVRSHQEYHR